jgi:hypothetical protein
MKVKLSILLLGVVLLLTSVSCSASPPNKDVGTKHVPKIKQMATEQTQIQTVMIQPFEVTPFAVFYVPSSLFVKPLESLQSAYLPVHPTLNFCYSEGRATEYHC